MLKFIKKYRFRISIIFLLLFFLFTLLVQVDKQRTENWFTASVQTIAYPFQLSFAVVTRQARDLWLHYMWLTDVREKNKQLRIELNELKAESSRNREIRISYENLLSILDFSKNNPDKKVFAEVIGEVKRDFSRLMIINKGYRDGVKPNFAVVSHDGVIGKVQSVTPFQSTVQLITDSLSKYPVMLQRTRTKAMLQGENGTLQIIDIPRRIDVKPDDLVITSGLAGIFPKGFPVGKVEEVSKKKFGLFQTATLAPLVDLDNIEVVSVVLRSVRNIHQPLFTEKGEK